MKNLVYFYETKSIKLEKKSGNFDGRIEGYASIFGSPDQGKDVVVKGAFKKALNKKGHDFKFLWQHDSSKPIGVIEEIFEDDKGLFISAKMLTSTSYGQDAFNLFDAGIIDGLSIGYNVIKSHKLKGYPYRYLDEIDLWEVSLVTFPMLQSARAEIAKNNLCVGSAPQLATDENNSWEQIITKNKSKNDLVVEADVASGMQVIACNLLNCLKIIERQNSMGVWDAR